MLTPEERRIELLSKRVGKAIESLIELLNAIQKQIESVSGKQQAENEHNQPQEPPFVRLNPQLEQAVAVYYETGKYRNPGTDWWKWANLALAVLSLLALVGYACITYRQWTAMNTQIGIMQEQVESTDRPWAKAEITNVAGYEPFSGGGASFKTPLAIDENGQGSLMFSWTVKNVGKSVANHIDFAYRVLAQASVLNPVEEQKRVCAEPKLGQEALFAEDPPLTGTAIGIFQTRGVTRSKLDNSFYLFVVGCVNYDYGSATGPHQTGFIYAVYGAKSSPPIYQMLTVPLIRPVDSLFYEPRATYAY